MRPVPKRLSPAFLTGWLLGPRNSRETIRAGAQGSVGDAAWLIGRARSHCQPAFSKNSKKLRYGCPVAANLATSSSSLLQYLDCLRNPLALRTFGRLGQARTWKVNHDGGRISLQNWKRQGGPRKRNKNKDGKALVWVASLHLFPRAGYTAPTLAVRHPAQKRRGPPSSLIILLHRIRVPGLTGATRPNKLRCAE